MFEFIIVLFFILIAALVYKEYKNEKAYQRSREQKRSTISQKDTLDVNKEKITLPVELPKADHPPFTHNRLLEMGLNDNEAEEFVHELIRQIETQIPLIQQALKAQDYSAMEHLTHSLKGSATNIGAGGIADLLVQYNTYLKSGEDHTIAEAYFGHLLDYTQALKRQYS